MMKTIKKRLNLYTKNILMGWNPVCFQNLHLFSLQVTYNVIKEILGIHCKASNDGCRAEPL